MYVEERRSELKAILIYDLTEERDEFMDSIKAGDMKSMLSDLDEWLRQTIKYNSENESEEAVDTYQKVRDKLHELKLDWEVTLN